MISTLLASGNLLDDLGINGVVWATQVVIFVITFLVLSRLLFGRALGHMQQREEEIRKAHEAIQRDRAEVERMTKEYEAHLAKVDKEGYDKTQEILREALAAAQASVAKAQADAKAETERAEKVMDTAVDAAAAGAAVQKLIQGRS